MRFFAFRRVWALLLSLALLCSLVTPVSAAEDDTGTEKPPAEEVDKTPNPIQLDRSSATMHVDDVLELRVTTSGTNQNVFPFAKGSEIRWTTSNPSVATVSPRTSVLENGKLEPCTVTALSVGEVTVTANCYFDGQFIAPALNCNITVEPTPVRLDQTSKHLRVGESFDLTATVNVPSNANRLLEWFVEAVPEGCVRLENSQSQDNTVQTVKAVATGTATVIARLAGNPREQAFCSIVVDAPDTTRVTAVQITNTKGQYIDVGKTMELKADVFPGTAFDKGVFWTSSDTSVATVDSSGVVKGIKPGKATITVTTDDGGFKDTYDLEVSGILLGKHSLSLFINHSETLAYEVFGNAKGISPTWTAVNPSIADPRSASVGRITGHFEGSTTITVTAGKYTDTCEVTVTEDLADAIYVSTGSASTYEFSDLAGTLNQRCRSKTDASLSNIYNLDLSTSQGNLYYGFVSPGSPGHGVGGSERYYYSPTGSQNDIDEITFVPKVDFSGTAEISYTGVSTTGETFTGLIFIDVNNSGDVSYSTVQDEPVSFNAQDFASVCMAKTGRSLRYLTFDLPAESRGTLYYQYSPSQFSPKVSSATKYYPNSSPSLSLITFVPAPSFVGTVDITYHYIDSSGLSSSGSVRITVYSPSGSSGSGETDFYTGVNQRLTLTNTPFNDACRRTVGGTLSYVRFDSLPSSSAGILYYNYSNSSSSRVSTSTRYYRTSTPRLSNISFVPASGYRGTVSIPYTGVNTAGNSFSGVLTITVGTGYGTGRTIYYSTTTNGVIYFDSADFNAACRGITGNTLNYVRFTQPGSSRGTLYYRYDDSSKKTSVGSGTNYYRSNSSRLISDVAYVAPSKAGTYTVSYTGWNSGGESFTGRIEISVTASDPLPSTSVIRYSGCSLPIAFRSTDFQALCQSTLGNALSYIQLNNLPSFGKLYLNYVSPSQPGTLVTAGTNYYPSTNPSISQITYVPQADYQGTVTLSYTAVDSTGRKGTNTIEINLSNANCTSSFSDMAGWDWVLPAVEYLRDGGITNGYGNGQFGPARPISRGEFTLMVCRAFGFSTTGSSSGFPDVPDSSVYAGAISTARNLGIVQGNNGLFQPYGAVTRQAAMTMVCRAMAADGRNLPSAPITVLNGASDGYQVAPYARASVAALMDMGAVRVNNNGQLNPTIAITRADMAILLHRILTR